MNWNERLTLWSWYVLPLTSAWGGTLLTYDAWWWKLAGVVVLGCALFHQSTLIRVALDERAPA